MAGSEAAADGHEGRIAVKRAYLDAEPDDGWRVLVDRVWPRGMTREALRVDERCPDVAPSSVLRRWFGHDPERWDEFVERYRSELSSPAAATALDALAARARRGRVTLVYSARDETHNQAQVLRRVLEERLASPMAASDRGPGGVGAGEPGADMEALVEAVERLVRAGVAVTTRALEERPFVDLTVQQWRGLVMIADADGLRIGSIADRLGQSVPSASRLVQRLEDRGMVRSAPDPSDRRASLVRLSARGERAVRAVLDRRRRLVRDALAAGQEVLPQGSASVVEILARALDHLS